MDSSPGKAEMGMFDQTRNAFNKTIAPYGAVRTGKENVKESSASSITLE